MSRIYKENINIISRVSHLGRPAYFIFKKSFQKRQIRLLPKATK